MEIYYFWFFLFVIGAYFIVTDESVAKLVNYTSRLLKFQYEKTKWWILHNPANPIVKYLIWRRSYKLAEKIKKEMDSK